MVYGNAPVPIDLWVGVYASVCGCLERLLQYTTNISNYQIFRVVVFNNLMLITFQESLAYVKNYSYLCKLFDLSISQVGVYSSNIFECLARLSFPPT